MTPRGSPTRTAWMHWLLIVLFLIAIGSPLAARTLHIEIGPRIHENRALRKMPRLPQSAKALIRFPSAFEEHWNDTFGFRPMLIRWHSQLKLAAGMTPSPKVTVGKRGWLFLAESLDDYRGIRPFTTQELEEWRRELEARHDWLAGRGVRYLFVIAPEKDSIHGEFVPGTLNRVRLDRRLDQLRAYLDRHSHVNVPDLRPALSAERRRVQVYYQHDTHWNGFGALVATREITARLSEWFPELGVPTATHAGMQMRRGGDLAGMLGLQDLLHEHSVELTPLAPCRLGADLFEVPRNGQMKTQDCAGARGPRLILFHDSFGPSLLPFLASVSRRIVSSWTFDPELVERELPDVVVQQVAERRLLEPVRKVRWERIVGQFSR